MHRLPPPLAFDYFFNRIVPGAILSAAGVLAALFAAVLIGGAL